MERRVHLAGLIMLIYGNACGELECVRMFEIGQAKKLIQ